jgi:hypothetical protein
MRGHFTTHRGWKIFRVDDRQWQVKNPDGQRYVVAFPEQLPVLDAIAMCRMWIDWAIDPAAVLSAAAIDE